MREETIIIPALEPSTKMLLLIHDLQEEGFQHIIVINDGSSNKARKIFDEAASMGCTVLTHSKNRGKGIAIKTGIKAHKKKYGHRYGVITVDADGQHAPKDVSRISEHMQISPNSLILGVRDFSGKDVPKKSRWGNRITSVFFKLTTGVKCSDTQTGLRGIPPYLFPLALSCEGSRYEYEMNFLEDASNETDIEEVKIETIYEDGNVESHFRPVRDSARVYGRFLRFVASSLSGSAVDFIFFAIVVSMFHMSHAKLILTATITARLMSGFSNFLMNKYWCFKNKDNSGRDLYGYMALFVTQMIVSAGLVTLVSLAIPTMLAKILIDTALFFVSYYVQKKYIFKTSQNHNKVKRLKLSHEA